MTKFYTIISFGPEPNADTDTNSYSHRSVRSYKTLNAAKQAMKRSTPKNNPILNGLPYKFLLTMIHSDGSISVEWVVE